MQNFMANPFFASDRVSSHSISPFVAIGNLKSDIVTTNSLEILINVEFACKCHHGVYFVRKWIPLVKIHRIMSPLPHFSFCYKLYSASQNPLQMTTRTILRADSKSETIVVLISNSKHYLKTPVSTCFHWNEIQFNHDDEFDVEYLLLGWALVSHRSQMIADLISNSLWGLYKNL